MIALERADQALPGAAEPAVRRRSTSTIPEGEIVILVGPSGCGKTTTHEDDQPASSSPPRGTIRLDGEDVTRPTRTSCAAGSATSSSRSGCSRTRPSAENIATVPQAAGLGRASGSSERVDELLRPGRDGPADLPRPLPEGALRRPAPAHRRGPGAGGRPAGDAHGRAVRRASTRSPASGCRTSSCACRQEISKTIVFVTHDIDEAIKMGDRIAILRERSAVAQYDTPETILAAPADDFVREFIGSGAVAQAPRPAGCATSTSASGRRPRLRRAGDAALRRGRRPPATARCCSSTTAPAAALGRPASSRDAAEPLDRHGLAGPRVVEPHATLAAALEALLGQPGRRRGVVDGARRLPGHRRPAARSWRRSRPCAAPRTSTAGAVERGDRADRRGRRPMTAVTDDPYTRVDPARRSRPPRRGPRAPRALPRPARRAGRSSCVAVAVYVARADLDDIERRLLDLRPACARPRCVHLQLVAVSTLLVIAARRPARASSSPGPSARRLAPLVVGLGNLGQTRAVARRDRPVRDPVRARLPRGGRRPGRLRLPADPAQHHRRAAADRPLRRRVGARHGHVEPAASCARSSCRSRCR